MSDVRPLVFEPILIEKVWGGDALGAFSKKIPAGANIGESWELADLASTSAWGAGGGAKVSVVQGGPLDSKSIAEVRAIWGDDLFPGAAAQALPLLIKLLDARQDLSVQVHPSPEYASSHPDALLKTECWYVLSAEEGGVLYIGLEDGIGRDELAEALESGQIEKVMRKVPAVPGEMHELPSGTVHALGAGVVVAEVQTPSDTTFRLFDWNQKWGREPREMHIDQGLECAVFKDPPGPRSADDGDLVSNRHYRVREVRGHCEQVKLSLDGWAVVMLVDGMGASVSWDHPDGEEVELAKGRTCLVPHAIAPRASLRAGPGTRALVVTTG